MTCDLEDLLAGMNVSQCQAAMHQICNKAGGEALPASPSICCNYMVPGAGFLISCTSKVSLQLCLKLD